MECREDLSKKQKKLKWLKFLRVLMCITIILIPLVVLKTNPKIKILKGVIEEADQRAEALLREANEQMHPLNRLFTDRDALQIIESTIPLMSFDKCFTVKQEADMKINYDFTGTALEGLVDPYVILKKAGRKIGIIGLLPDVSNVVSVDLIRGLQYQDPVGVVNDYARYLHDEKKCDLVICLSHLGFRKDKYLASQVRNVDLIVGGHSHTQLEEIVLVEDLDGRTVRIVQNWHWGLNVGNLKLTWE
jgi:hypothetical protein